LTTNKASATSKVFLAARRTQPRGRHSARKLLDAAAALFLEKGVNETTIDDIVLRAGIAKGTFYHHYESKAALSNALREQVIGDFEARVDAAMTACPPDDLRRQLDAWVEAVCESDLMMGPLHDIVFSIAPPRWSASDRKFMQTLIALLRKGHAQGVWRADDPRLAATFLFNGLHGVIDDLLLRNEHPVAVRNIVALARKAIMPERGLVAFDEL
jgi:AcrR family transcriptional regulator